MLIFGIALIVLQFVLIFAIDKRKKQDKPITALRTIQIILILAGLATIIASLM